MLSSALQEYSKEYKCFKCDRTFVKSKTMRDHERHCAFCPKCSLWRDERHKSLCKGPSNRNKYSICLLCRKATTDREMSSHFRNYHATEGRFYPSRSPNVMREDVYTQLEALRSEGFETVISIVEENGRLCRDRSYLGILLQARNYLRAQIIRHRSLQQYAQRHDISTVNENLICSQGNGLQHVCGDIKQEPISYIPFFRVIYSALKF